MNEVGVGLPVTHVFDYVGEVQPTVDLIVTVMSTPQRCWVQGALPARSGERSTWLVDWTVTLSDPKAPEPDPPLPVDVRVRVLGYTSDSEVLRVQPRGQIRVTDDQRLTRIMLHEFARKDASGAWEFDPTRPEEVIAALTPEQRLVLASTRPTRGKGRLVVFITLTGKARRRLLGADFCRQAVWYGWGNTAHTNASFTVFRCGGPGEDVVLALHTDAFLMSPLNRATMELVDELRRLPRDVKPPAGVTLEKGLLDRRCPAPRRYVIATGIPDVGNADVPWSRVFTPRNRDVMPGNTMHGMINSHGCWMLFRNFNWPRRHYEAFQRIYESYRVHGEGERLQADLEAVVPGYETAKFWFVDRNHAYKWFFHELIGLRYWGDEPRFGPMNDFAVHGNEVHPTVPRPLPDARVRYPDEAGSKHDGYPTPTDKAFYQDSWWGTNVFGDQPATAFYRTTNLEAAAWADVYFFAEPDEDFPNKT